jgi:hypothetical protein
MPRPACGTAQTKFKNNAYLTQERWHDWIAHLEHVTMLRAQLRYEPEGTLSHVYFQPIAIVSLLYVMQNGESHQPLSYYNLGDAALRQLLSTVARPARDFVACGPRRSQPDSRMLFALACNDVTQHDAGQRARRFCRARG